MLQVEIEPDSGVYVSESVLKIDVLRFKNRPSEMVRRLMLILVGRDELKKMTARGRLTNPSQKGKPKPRKAVPEKILYAVKCMNSPSSSIPITRTNIYNL